MICSRFAQKVSELGLTDYALASAQTCAQQTLLLSVHQMHQILGRNLHSGQGCVQYAGPKDKLDSTAVSQPAIYVASLAALEKLKQTEGQVHLYMSLQCSLNSILGLVALTQHCIIDPAVTNPLLQLWHTHPTMGLQEALDAADVAGGLSLGEYTALTFAGAMRYCSCTHLLVLTRLARQQSLHSTSSHASTHAVAGHLHMHKHFQCMNTSHQTSPLFTA